MCIHGLQSSGDIASRVHRAFVEGGQSHAKSREIPLRFRALSQRPSIAGRSWAQRNHKCSVAGRSSVRAPSPSRRKHLQLPQIATWRSESSRTRDACSSTDEGRLLLYHPSTYIVTNFGLEIWHFR